jgi:hypothetical protein
MKKIFLLFLFTFSCLYAQVDIQGTLSSSFYSFESPSTKQDLLNQYHGFNFKINPENNSDLFFKGNIKAIRDNEPLEWREKVYNAYVSWKTPFADSRLQVGRQFVYAGVVHGTLDAVSLFLKPVNNLDVRLFGGVVAPYDRKMEVTRWEDGNALGGYGSYRINRMFKLNASYFQKQRNDELYWQQLGTTLSGSFNNITYLVKYDHNLLSSDYQTILVYTAYDYKDWSFTGEVSSKKPQIYEDSFFSIFKLREHNQIRVAVSRRIASYEIGFQAINTLFKEDENNQQYIATLGNNWGVLGVVYQTGYGGENVGLYADISYMLMSDLRFILHSSHYRYERESVQLNEEATSFSAGFRYSPQKSLGVGIQVQQSLNSYYKSDFRGLLNLSYSFNY